MWLHSNDESRYQLESEVVVHRVDILFGAPIALGGLDGRVIQQKLDLLQILVFERHEYALRSYARKGIDGHCPLIGNRDDGPRRNARDSFYCKTAVKELTA